MRDMRRPIDGWTLWGILCVVLLLGACTEEPLGPEEVELKVTVTMPPDYDYISQGGVMVHVRNNSLGTEDSIETDANGEAVFHLLAGKYDILATKQLEKEKVIVLFQKGATGRLLLGGHAQLPFPLEVSSVPNPEYNPGKGTIPLKVEVELPDGIPTPAYSSIEVTAEHAVMHSKLKGKMDERGNLTLRLRPGLYTLRATGLYVDTVNRLEYVLRGEVGDVAVVADADNQARLQLESKVQKMSPLLPVEIQPIRPSGYRLLSPTLEINAKRESDGRLFSFAGEADKLEIQLPKGEYTFYVHYSAGDASRERIYTFSGQKKQWVYPGVKPIMPELHFSSTASSWLLQEIYYTGSRTPAGRGYWADQYICLYNNSPYTLYADGLCLSHTPETATLPDNKRWKKNYDNPIAYIIFQIPGSGQEHPVPPGGTILIANQGLNHPTVNPNSHEDMSHADFEWYEPDKYNQDIDVITVPNLHVWFTYSLTITVLHVRGNWPFFLWRPDTDMQTFMQKHVATAIYPSGATITAYEVPEEFILDAVQTGPSPAKGVITNYSFSKRLDAGFAYCDDTYIQKSIRRKVSRVVNGRVILQDLNNSSEDFLMNRTPHPRQVEALD